eukprot:TRINITY_DN42347_c0_g1_i1.p1 TRINITY_DN42347_c0_g1~~TRINITY_DN42347_c0_g1_i1.p1  ORF type:complete len:504 (+),score=159.49 TRINITY_DN42347_c0_g1_i1:59-1513(+)
MSRVDVVKDNWKGRMRREAIMGRERYEQAERGQYREEFRVSKVLQQFDVKPVAEVNMLQAVNTKPEQLVNGGFQDMVQVHASKLTNEQRTIKLNMASERDSRVRGHLFKMGNRRFEDVGVAMSAELEAAIRSQLQDPQSVDGNTVLEAVREANFEVPLAAYYLNRVHGVELAPGATGCGVVTAELLPNRGGAIVKLECATMGRSLEEGFLRLAKRVARAAATLPIASDPEGLIERLLTTQMHDSTKFVCDELIAASKSWGEPVKITAVSLVPCPPQALLGLYILNPRDVYPGQGAGVSVVTFLLDEADAMLLEPEWTARLQSTVPPALAQHCMLEPLYVGAGGRVLKQPVMFSLTGHEAMRYPDGRPALYDWLEDQMSRARVTATRFGVVTTRLGYSTDDKTWVSLAAESHRYDKFSSRTDPPPLENGEKDLRSHNTRIKADHADEELWFNEPGQMTHTELKEEQAKGMPSGFETDDELMNKSA